MTGLIAAAAFVGGLIRDIDPVFLVPVALFVAGGVLWIWNQFTIRTQFRLEKGVRGVLAPPASDLPRATEEELREDYISGRVFRLVDVPRASGATGRVVRGKVFEDCEIEGPAIIAYDRCVFGDNTLVADKDSPLEVVTAATWMHDPGLLIGVFGMVDCVVKRCRLVEIGFAFTNQELRDQFRMAAARATGNTPCGPSCGLTLTSREARAAISDVHIQLQTGRAAPTARPPICTVPIPNNSAIFDVIEAHLRGDDETPR